MGCTPCYGRTPADSETRKASKDTLQIPHEHYIDGPRKSVTQTKEIKLSRSNYVLVSSGRLSDTYQIEEKIGEGRD